MMNLNCLVASLLISFLSTLSTISWARGSEAEDPSKQSKTYLAFIGNHDSVTVEVDEDWILVASQRGPAKTVYVLNWNSSKIDITSGESSSSLTPADQAYNSTLELMRNLVAYTTIPQRYTWNVFGTEPLNLGLSQMIGKLDALLSNRQGFSPNCVVYSNDGSARLEVSVGTYGNLGSLANNIAGAWVRGGYELVLVPAQDFELSAGPAVLINDNERLDASFDLTSEGKTAESLACRPSIF